MHRGVNFPKLLLTLKLRHYIPPGQYLAYTTPTMNKQELISALKNLDALTADQKSYLIDLVNTKKKYGLVWEDKPEDVEELLRQHLPVLTEVPERRILAMPHQPAEPVPAKAAQSTTQASLTFAEPKPADVEAAPTAQAMASTLPDHLLIEGDNLHALTALTFTHEGRVDVIYIDPPYNTGNKDFKYNDRFVDREDAYRHSKWLSFMHKRLLIAKRLLAETGVIFISIDDNEQAQLKMLCDEVFGEENLIGPIIQNKQNAKNDTVNIQKNHEHILVYRKVTIMQGSKVIPSLINSDFKTRDIYEEEDIYYYLNDAITTRGEGGVLNARPNLGHTIYYNPETKDKIAVCDYDVELAKTSNDFKKIYSIDKDLISKGYEAIRPPKVRGKLGCWTWSLDKINEDKNDLIVTGKPGSYAVKKRTFVAKELVSQRKGKLYFDTKTEGNSRSILDYSTNDGTSILNEVLGVSGKFNNPKNLEMIKYFLALTPKKNALILDFFAGSGTSLHATMQLNAEDGGTRQCILVTNNENNIAEEVCYERNKRVIQGYTGRRSGNAKGQAVPGLTNNSLRYYRCETVPRETTLPAKRLLMQRATELLCIKEGLYHEVPSLTRPALSVGTQIRGYGGGPASGQDARYLLIIYDDLCIDEAVTLIRQTVATEPDARFRVYVFSNGQYPYTEEFEEVLPYVTLCALPDALYKAYRQVLPAEQAPVRPADEPQELDLFNQIVG
jgi:adenine-specific DNA-methyltransferase